jgi:hypothetical protein
MPDLELMSNQASRPGHAQTVNNLDYVKKLQAKKEEA